MSCEEFEEAEPVWSDKEEARGHLVSAYNYLKDG